MSDSPVDANFLRGLLEGLPYRIVVRDSEGREVYSNRTGPDSAPPASSPLEVTPRALRIPGDDRDLVLLAGSDIPDSESTRRRLLHAQRMETMGRLTGGIAHEYNNLLGIVLGYAELLEDSLEPDSHEREDLGAIQRAAQRGRDLTSQLLAFSRQEILDPQRVTPNERLHELEKLLQRTMGEDIRLKLVLGETPDVLVDPGALEQVVLNLAVNAREAMPTGGVLTLRTSTVEIAEGTTGDLAPGSYACILVRDTGPGIDPEVLNQIFEPFFTTKDIGDGSGLGLATVDGIVAQSGGTIRVSSGPGEGAAFEVLLPAMEDAQESPEPLAISSPGGTRNVLVVEDEEPLRLLVCRHLRAAGYHTISAPDAAAALEAFEQFPGRIHALLTDVVMPGTSGVELAKQLLVKSPKLRVLYMTGYTDESALHHGIDPRRATILRKPFERQKLLAKLGEILEVAPPPSRSSE